jgi:SAM-dependent methyltransferase
MLDRLRRFFGGAAAEHPSVSEEPFGGHYEEWRNKRIKAIIDHYGPDFFRNKRVLEVGCGYGDIGAAIAARGAIVTCSDARQEHLDVVKQRHPSVEVLKADMDSARPISGKWDVLIHMGLLYHLGNPETALIDACSLTDYLVLETEVCDSDDAHFLVRLTDLENAGVSGAYDQAFNIVGARPSAAFVERVITSCGMTFDRQWSSSCNSSFHEYDWTPKNDGSWRHGLRRMWFAKRSIGV